MSTTPSVTPLGGGGGGGASLQNRPLARVNGEGDASSVTSSVVQRLWPRVLVLARDVPPPPPFTGGGAAAAAAAAGAGRDGEEPPTPSAAAGDDGRAVRRWGPGGPGAALGGEGKIGLVPPWAFNTDRMGLCAL